MLPNKTDLRCMSAPEWSSRKHGLPGSSSNHPSFDLTPSHQRLLSCRKVQLKASFGEDVTGRASTKFSIPVATARVSYLEVLCTRPSDTICASGLWQHPVRTMPKFGLRQPRRELGHFQAQLMAAPPAGDNTAVTHPPSHSYEPVTTPVSMPSPADLDEYLQRTPKHTQSQNHTKSHRRVRPVKTSETQHVHHRSVNRHGSMLHQIAVSRIGFRAWGLGRTKPTKQHASRSVRVGPHLATLSGVVPYFALEISSRSGLEPRKGQYYAGSKETRYHFDPNIPRTIFRPTTRDEQGPAKRTQYTVKHICRPGNKLESICKSRGREPQDTIGTEKNNGGGGSTNRKAVVRKVR